MPKLFLAGLTTAFLAAQISSSGRSAEPVADVSCQVDTEAILRLSPSEFDQDPTGGWRTLTATPGCEVVIADLLAEYRRRNWGIFKEYELHLNYWHEGQVRAFAGQYDEAVPLLLAGVDPHAIGGFSEYALATVAFLQNNRQALKAARDRLAAVPRPEFVPDGEWPPNLKIVDSLIACFGRPYSEAYSGHCPSAS
jgi:hypothetical protein